MRDDTPDETRRGRLSRTFDEDAELYDRARPGYPPELFDDLADVAGTSPGCRVLEVGAGTGKATLPLAERGYRITAVELGSGMAGVARRNLAGFEAVEIVTADFETWPLPQEPFDAVVSATAFHWIDPAVRMAKAADALRPGGALAVVATQHVAGGSEQFFVEVQDCYERFDPATPPGLRLPAAEDVDTSDHTEEVARSGRFGPVVFRRYEWDLTYTTAAYLEVLRTYSGHRALLPEAREGLLGCIAGQIDRRYGGRITKRYLTELRVSRTPHILR
ncbi:class I SAM-dependent methyltransferase [Streptomyces sp. HD]|uniref:class I SAM-dependent methyltransferase n=1 Tax=Streptomyces sp. HD TaxID=3020892 RepID=UPI00232E4CF7|nr:class I SAM-dependent methyltransferase [Streptomyces sp. HD]MDC0772467.1 class I SAM-dependent methyltransferase [Streptomyces sp. HD]